MPANPLGLALRNRRAGHHTLVWARPDLQAPENFTLTSPAFDHGTPIPERYRGRLFGANISPALAWTTPSAETAELVLIVQDPDVPFGKPATHALTLGIDPSLSGIPENGLTDPSPIPRAQTRQRRPRPPRLGRPQTPALARTTLLRLPTLRPGLPARPAGQVHPRRCTPRRGRTCHRTRPARRHLRNPVTAHQQSLNRSRPGVNQIAPLCAARGTLVFQGKSVQTVAGARNRVRRAPERAPM
jgi:hypothetical protein